MSDGGRRDDEAPRLHDRSPAERATYLALVLRANPLHRADEIVDRRARFLGNAEPSHSSSAPDPNRVRESRSFVGDRIDGLRERFWQLDVTHVAEALDELNLEPFPDLERAAERLRTVTVHRRQFPLLADERGFDPDFFTCLKRVCVAGPKEAALERERALAMCRRPGRSKRIKKMVKSVAKSMPAIYEMESDWFQALANRRPEKDQTAGSNVSSAPHDDDAGYGFGCLWWFLAIVAFRVIRLLTTSE